MPQEPEEFPLRVFSVESEPPNDLLDEDDPADDRWVGTLPTVEDLQQAFAVFAEGTPEISHLRALSDLDKERLAWMREHWLDLDDQVRPAITSLAVQAGEEHVTLDYRRFLEFAMEDPSPAVRQFAVDGFANYVNVQSADLLLSHLTQDPSPDVRAEAAGALSWYADGLDTTPGDIALGKRIHKVLLKIAGQPGEAHQVRARALETASLFGRDAELMRLIDEFYDEDETGLRISALFAMGQSGDTRWLPILTGELASPDNETRRVAASALGFLDDPDALPDLRKLMRDADVEVRHAAILAIGNISGPASKRILEQLADDPLEEDAEVIFEALEMEELFSSVDEDPDGIRPDDGSSLFS